MLTILRLHVVADSENMKAKFLTVRDEDGGETARESEETARDCSETAEGADTARSDRPDVTCKKPEEIAREDGGNVKVRI